MGSADHGHVVSAADDEHVPLDQVRLPKKLIICCDGTWQDSDNGWVAGSGGRPGHLQIPTNVTRICRAIKPEDDERHPQIVYYQAGVGTGMGLVSHLLGGGTGLGLSENIREAYAFLCNNYSLQAEDVQPDSIFLLGFSRGAFTARSLGGFIGAVGVLVKRAMPYFYQCFLDWENAGDPNYTPMFIDAFVKGHPDQESAATQGRPSLSLAHDRGRIDEYMDRYRKHLLSLGLTQEVKINCIGVWDTVGALGIPVNPVIQKLVPFLPAFIREYSWFDTRISDSINNAFHALALDEHRFPFSPSVWEKPGKESTTNLKQVWFPGAHSNVGGSYEDAGMANITLAWMMDQLSGNTLDTTKSKFRARDWIQFDEGFIDHWNFETSNFYSKEPEKRRAYHGWGMGKVYDSDTFPQSVLGHRVRRPGRYHRTDYVTGKQTDQRLENTAEYIHSSVRARIDLAGREVESQSTYQSILGRIWRWLTFQTRPTCYRPQRTAGWLSSRGPLAGWKLKDGHATHREPNMNIEMAPDGLDKIEWEYVGPDTPSTRVMPEDRMAPGGFEHRLLMKHDAEVAQKIAYTNHGWRHAKSVLEDPVSNSNF